jgi:hypothetical protein
MAESRELPRAHPIIHPLTSFLWDFGTKMVTSQIGKANLDQREGEIIPFVDSILTACFWGKIGYDRRE